MRSKHIKWLFLLLVIQSVIIYAHFNVFFRQPETSAFTNLYDGLKNSYTLYTYVNDTTPASLLHFGMMNYPYGDLIYFTDNTPAFALPYKVLSTYYPAIKSYALSTFNFVVLLNLLTASIILFFILIRFSSSWLVVLMLSVALPWINPMLFRLSCNLNLSLSSVVLLGIWLILKLYEHKDASFQFWLSASFLILLNIVSFFIHPYLVFVLVFMTGFFLLASAISRRNGKLLASSVFIPIVSLAICQSILLFTDQESAARSVHVLGYGLNDWETSVSSLLTPYRHNTVHFLFKKDVYTFHDEARAYIGSGAFVLLIVLAILLLRKEFRTGFLQIFRVKNLALPIMPILLTVLFMIMLSFGEDYYLFGTKHHFYNIFNPIFILRKTILPQLTHLRFCGRYFFPAFFLLYIFLAAVLEIIKKQKSLLYYALMPVVIFLIGIDTYDGVRVMEATYNPFSANNLATFKSPLLLSNHYDAVLPIPYFHVGSEDAAYTIETDDNFFSYTLQFSAANSIPLMSCKMSRTPEYQNKNLVDVFVNKKVNEDLKSKLSGKTILVLYNKPLNAQYATTPPQGPSLTGQVATNGINLPNDLGMKKIMETDNLIYYVWQINDLP